MDIGSYNFFNSLNPRVKNSTICTFGIGVQDMSTCKMIYIHIPGYYPTEKSYQEALHLLCPNINKVVE